MTKSALIIRLIELLKNRPGIAMDEMVAELGRSERTVYRWLSQLAEDLNAGLVCKDGGYYLADHDGCRSVDLTAQELMSLRLSLKSSPFADSSPIKRHADSAWLKIRNAMETVKLEAVRELATTHVVEITAPPVSLASTRSSNPPSIATANCALRIGRRRATG